MAAKVFALVAICVFAQGAQAQFGGRFSGVGKSFQGGLAKLEAAVANAMGFNEEKLAEMKGKMTQMEADFTKQFISPEELAALKDIVHKTAVHDAEAKAAEMMGISQEQLDWMKSVVQGVRDVPQWEQDTVADFGITNEQLADMKKSVGEFERIAAELMGISEEQLAVMKDNIWSRFPQ